MIYLLCGTRADISFAVGQLNKCNIDPRVGHLRVAKRVVLYLKSTMYLGIIYDASNSPSHGASNRQLLYRLVGYAKSNYTGNLKDQKSMMGHCFFINRIVVLWYSKKQQTVSISTTEVEYIALGHVARQSV